MGGRQERLLELIQLLGDPTPRRVGTVDSGSIPEGRWAALTLVEQFKAEGVIRLAGMLRAWKRFDPNSPLMVRMFGFRSREHAKLWKHQAIFNAIHALSATASSRMILHHELTSEDAHRRECAAAALGAIGDRSAVEPLIDLLKDSNVEVSDAAFSALRRITGKSFVFGKKDPAKWRAWWAKRNPPVAK